MNRQQKKETVEVLRKKFEESNFFYLTDSSTLTVEEVNDFRRLCFEKGIEMKVVKNSLAIKALEAIEDDSRNFNELHEALKGPTAILFTDTANSPAKLIEEFRKSHDRPVLKAAYIDTSVFKGDDKIKELASLKSREELIGDVILLLQSPAKNLISALKSGGQTISGLLKALEERGGDA